MSQNSESGAEKYQVTQRMGIVTFSVAINSDKTKWNVPAKLLAKWLVSYDRYWRQESGVNDGFNQHWLYDRAVSLRGNYLDQIPSEIKVLTDQAKALTLGVNWLLSLESLNEIKQDKSDFLKSVDIRAITLVISKNSIINDSTVDLLCTLMESGVNITYLGWVAKLKDMNAFTRKTMNKLPMTLINRPSGDGEVVFRRERTSNCKQRIQLSVGPKGDIYPCIGLAGLKATSLGSIHDPVSSLLKKGGNKYLDLDRLVSNGPDLDEYIEGEIDIGSSLDCHFHRKEIIEAEFAAQ